MNKKPNYSKRRKKIIKKMGSDALAIFPSAPDTDERHIYRQDSDFYYLTGFEEPHCIAVLYEDQSGHPQFVLFNRPEDIQAAIWTGALAGQTGACEEYGANASYPIDQFEEKLLPLCEGKKQIYYPMGRYPNVDQKLLKLMDKMKASSKMVAHFPMGLMNSDQLVHEMRLIKDGEEIELMRKAARISAQAHTQIMRACRPGMFEYELKADLVYEFFKQGAREEAYPIIVGGGENACVLHYTENKALLSDGDLVLVDAGASYAYYASDITRTFPVNGRFTSEQAAIYELVLQAQLAVIEKIKPGIEFMLLQKTAVEVLTRGLVDLGFLNGRISDLIESKAYSAFFMHGVSHWLGIDVHDVGGYKINGQSRKLETGMVLTVEPGIYLSAQRLELEPQWKNIGIRIEDDVLVTDQGCEVLTKEVPKTIQEIEALRR